MAVLISVDGFVGGLLILPNFSEYVNHVYKTVVAVGIIALFSWVYALVTRGGGWFAYAAVCGAVWVILTVSFEFLAGHYLFGNPWSALFNDYWIWAGRLWILVILIILVGPTILGYFVNSGRK